MFAWMAIVIMICLPLMVYGQFRNLELQKQILKHMRKDDPML